MARWWQTDSGGRGGSGSYRGGRRFGGAEQSQAGDQPCGQAMTRGMSWFSLGLGAAQVAAPGKMVKMLGMRDTAESRRLMRLVGLREIISGVALTAGVSPRLGMALRVGGDLSDLAMLDSALRERRVNRTRIMGAMGAVAGALAADAYGTLKAGSSSSSSADQPYSPTSSNRPTPTTQTIVVNREPEEVYRFWSDFGQFPRFMKHLEQVSVRKDGTSHWKAYGPGGMRYEWDAEVVQDRPNELIAWRSLPGSQVENEGSVRFERAPGGRGTLLRVNLRYQPPAGMAGSAIAMLLGREPGQEVQEDLRRFKQVIETGEVVRSDATVYDSPRPARPPEDKYRLPKQVPGAGPTEAAHGTDDAKHEAWPQRDDRPAQRSDMDEAAATARGGSR